MDHVGGIKQLSNGGVDVFPGFLQSVLAVGGLGVVNVVEVEVLSTIRSVVGEVGIAALPVLMGKNVITPGNSGVADRRAMRVAFVGRVWVIGDRQGVPAQWTGERVAVLRLDGAVAFTWIVNAPLEDVIGGGAPVLPRDRGVGVGSPVNHRDDLVRRVGRDSSLIPVILHLNFKLPNEVEMGRVTIRNLYVGQTSLDGVDGLGDVADEFDGGMSFAANEATVHMGGHAIDVVIILGKDILNHVVLGGSGDHELEERVTRILQLVVLGHELGREFGERTSRLDYMLKRTEESIAIESEVFEDSLFAVELVLIMGVASVEFSKQLGTVVCMGMSGGLDGVATGRCALVSLDMAMSAVATVA